MKYVTKEQMVKKVMEYAHLSWKLRKLYSWSRNWTWSECLSAAWSTIKAGHAVRKKVKPAPAVKVVRYQENVDLSFLYGNGRYNGD